MAVLTADEVREIRRSGRCDLSNRRLTALPPEIGQLTSLQELTIDGNQLTTLPPEIGQLTSLQKLVLYRNQLTTLPSEIGQLTSLQELWVGRNQLTTLPPEIGQLASLETLGLAENQLTTLPSEIGQLTSLQKLFLDGNRLTALPLEIGQLTSLQELTIDGNRLTTLPPEIGQLTSLQELRLDGNRLTTLPPEIGQLTSLYQLVLYRNQLATLPAEIGRLTSLRELWLDGNRLTTLPAEIGQLTSLRELMLAENQLTSLPAEIADQLDNGLIVNLNGNPLEEPLPELLQQDSRAVAVYLRSLRDGIAQYEAKVLLIGEGNVGKTSLSAALRGDAFVEDRPFTHGIEIQPIVLRHPDAGEDMTIRVWDFGGQEVYRITHQFFFSRQALYLLVWKPREGQEQNEVEGWLRRIRLRVGPDAQVLIVATHCARNQHPDLDYPHLQREFPHMLVGHFEVDNRTCYGIRELRDAIAEQVARLPQMGQKISFRWVAVRDEIAEMTQMQPQMSFLDFTALCQRHHVGDDETGTLATLMHDLGQIIYYGADEGLQDFVVLNPEWLTKAISYVLRDDATRYSGGVLDHVRLREIWQDRQDGPGYPARYHRYFLRLMEKFDISYRLDDEQSSLVAQLVPYQRPDLPWDSRTPLPGLLRRLALVCQLGEPAPGLMAWLTVRHHGAATGKHWRTGVFLRHPIPAYNSEALLELTAPAQLAVEVRAPSPDLYFHVLSDSIETLIRSRWAGLTYQLLIPCPTVTIDGNRCPHLVSMEDLLAYREEGETRYLCVKCRVRHDVSVLLTGFPVPAQPMAAEMQQQLVRVENRLIRIESQAADTAAVIRRVLRVVSTEVGDCPNLFTLTRDRQTGDKLQQLYRHHYRLTLWCSQPGYWHPWDHATYQINPPKEWLSKISPYVALIVKTLQLAVPLAGSIAIASLPAEQAEKAAAHLEMMKTIVDDLPGQPIKELVDVDPRQVADQITAAEGEALRALRALIFEHDPLRKFGGLRRVQAPSGDFLWVCPNHYTEYDPGLPAVP
jgi:internalin A